MTYFNPVTSSGQSFSVKYDNLSLLFTGYIFISGMIAISAMVLPGISGSTILLIFGLYAPILSAIKKVLNMMDPSYYDLYRIREPQFNQKSAHFLKRFIGKVYSEKTLIILDRSWYGRVLVERVEKLDSEENIESAFDVIYNFEKELGESGIHVMKFWLNVSPEEQLKRFKNRVINKNKRWKIGERDWRNRLKSNIYNLRFWLLGPN